MSWRLNVVNESNVEDFVDICQEFFDLAQLQHLKFSRESATILAVRMMSDPTCFGQLAYDEVGCVGAMIGYVTPLIFSTSVIGNEEGLYVREGTKERAAIAAEMLRRFVRFCQDCGAVDVRTGVISQIDAYATDVFYRRNGFKRIGNIYALRNPGGV